MPSLPTAVVPDCPETYNSLAPLQREAIACTLEHEHALSAACSASLCSVTLSNASKKAFAHARTLNHCTKQLARSILGISKNAALSWCCSHEQPGPLCCRTAAAVNHALCCRRP